MMATSETLLKGKRRSPRTLRRGECSEQGCDEKAVARCLCQHHYDARRRKGVLPPKESIEERFWRQVEKTDTCWNWVGHLCKLGYGQICIGEKRPMAHRFAYELLVGLIPEGLTLDHLCRNRRCVNPLHLEPVTLRENVMRGTSTPAKNAKKTHCIRGHLLAGENLLSVKYGRACKECNRLRWHERRKKVLEGAMIRGMK